MIIKTQLTEKDFINANFVMLYNKTSTKVITGIGTLFLLLFIIFSMYDGKHSSISQFLTPAIILLGLPAMTYFAAKKNYATNHRISENIEYIFEEDHLQIKGSSFTTQLTWDKLYKVTETKNWIFIWHTAQTANPIAKKDIWEEQVAELKVLLDIHNVKNKLG